MKTKAPTKKTVVQANVVAQGVVRANRTRLQALIFLNQVVTRERDGKPETVLTPFKVLVTMVHTDQGWLVDGLDTAAQRPARPTMGSAAAPGTWNLSLGVGGAITADSDAAMGLSS